MHRIAYALCAGCVAALGLGLPANADPVTYTWETLSSVPPGGRSVAPTLYLSFTVDGPMSVNANETFADTNQGPPPTPVTYPFPANLTSFDLNISFLSVTLADFTSRAPGLNTPLWNISLVANPANMTANLSLFFLDRLDTNEIYGPPTASSNPFQASTGAVTTIDYGNDSFRTDAPAQYTGMLVATAAVPAPSSILILLSALCLFGAVGRYRLQRGAVRG